jgi:hypothetical protein
MKSSVFEQLQKVGITPESFPSLYQAILEVCVEIIREEREACVKVVEDHRKLWENEKVGYALDDVVDALRGRGK